MCEFYDTGPFSLKENHVIYLNHSWGANLVFDNPPLLLLETFYEN